MKKEKITLTDLKIQSFVTTLDEKQQTAVKGGSMTVRGRRFTYTSRWTSVDTRLDPVGDRGIVMGNQINPYRG